MSEDVWSATDTNPDAIDAALRSLLRRRHAADRAQAPARVLNLIVIVDSEWKAEVSERLKHVGRYHASRTILCSIEQGRTSLDAVATLATEEGAGGGVRPVRERVDIDLGSEQVGRLDTIVDPVLVSELPTMLWSPNGHEDAVEALVPLTDVILLDSDSLEADRSLGRADELRQSVYMVDLAWLRTTPWRERLAASFDLPARSGALSELSGVCVRHHRDSLASAALMAGWLATRLDWDVEPLRSLNGAGCAGMARAHDDGHEIEISLVPVDQQVPGLAGVTVRWDEGCSLSLDRGTGGLCASEQASGRQEQTWQVLGASRGEAGILGEGVRQALLRDATYPPALDRALELRGVAARA